MDSTVTGRDSFEALIPLDLGDQPQYDPDTGEILAAPAVEPEALGAMLVELDEIDARIALARLTFQDLIEELPPEMRFRMVERLDAIEELRESQQTMKKAITAAAVAARAGFSAKSDGWTVEYVAGKRTVARGDVEGLMRRRPDWAPELEALIRVGAPSARVVAKRQGPNARKDGANGESGPRALPAAARIAHVLLGD